MKYCEVENKDDANAIRISSSVAESAASRLYNNDYSESRCWIKLDKLYRFDYRRLHRNKRGRIRLGILTISFFILIYLCLSLHLAVEKGTPQIVDDILSGSKVPDGFSVWSPGCKMPSMNPFAEDVMSLFQVQKYEACSEISALSRIEMDWTTEVATLIVNETSQSPKLTCCYHEITRLGKGENIDNQFKLSTCKRFKQNVQLRKIVEFIFIKCEVHGKQVYKNTHAILREKPEVRKRLNEVKSKRKGARPLSVLMLAIDSISRLHLTRSMPNTAQHLHDNGWFELQGYNKIDDNTFPNVMAILAGFNETVTTEKCDPHVKGKLDKCPLIWSEFKKSGYATAYAEDEASLNTFNYQKAGFLTPPTDYYLRQYMLAAARYLHYERKYDLIFCLGYKHSVDHIYDFAMDFATHYKSEPSFGLFWTNTFSHNDINGPSSMDLKIKNYLNELESRGVLNESMVVFFSDHGMRFGPVRRLVTGWLEERLPFIFIWLPEWFRSEHPEIVEALKINRNRLTNPYDLHMTLKHVLELSQPNRSYPNAVSCPNCQSLFKEIPYNRTCEEASIAAHWCTCSPYKDHDTNDEIVRKATQIAIDHINQELKNQTDICSELKLKLISYSRKAEYRNTSDPYDDYIIVFELLPKGWFESTVRYKLLKKEFEITGSVSRLDSYADYSKCLNDEYLRKYCHCHQEDQTTTSAN